MQRAPLAFLARCPGLYNLDCLLFRGCLISPPACDMDMKRELEMVGVGDLGTVAEVEMALSSASAFTSSVEAKLENMLFDAASASASRAAALASVAQVATAASDDADDLTAVLDSSARASSALSVRVRFLAQALSVGLSALARVDHVLTLRVCAEGAKTSLSAGDLATAAAHVERYLALDADVREDPSSLAAVAQINQSIAELTRKVRKRTEELFSKEAPGAETATSVPALVSVVKLFVPIGLSDEGLSRFSDYVAIQIAREADTDVRSFLMDALSSDDTCTESQQHPHVFVLARLFENLAAYVHDAETPVVEVFGPDSLITLVMNLQKQCDAQSDKILVRFTEARSLDQIARAVRSEKANARDLDPLLSELSLLSQRTSAYFDFLKSRCAAVFEAGEIGDSLASAQNPSSSTTKERQSSSIDLLNQSLLSSKLSVWTEELATRYVTFEAYFMRENVRKAIRIDEQTGSDGAKTSTAVDDFFFVLQKVVTRSLTYGGNSNALLAMLEHMNTCMSGELLSFVRKRLRETEIAMSQALDKASGSVSLNSAASTVSYLAELAKANIPSSTGATNIGGGGGNLSDGKDAGKYDFFIALNNASVSADYAVRFQANVEQVASKQFQGSHLVDRVGLGGSLGLIGETARALSAANQQGLERLSNLLTSQIEGTTAKLLDQSSFVVGDGTSYAERNEESFSSPFLEVLEQKVLHPSVEKRLTESNWDALVRLVAEWTSNIVETGIFLPDRSKQADASNRLEKRFNALGGLKVDRDVRGLGAYFAGKCRGSSVRDVFARLSQISMLVNLESPTEIYDIWGGNAGGMTWRLAPTEVRMALRLRVDWSSHAISELRL